MSVTTGGVWVCLTYANNSSKLYPLSSLLPKPEHTTDPQLNLQLQQSTRLPQYDLCNDVASSMATAWHPTEIIHFPEVTLTDNKSAASHYTTDESSTNVNVKETKNVRFINNDKTDSRKNRKLNAAKIEVCYSSYSIYLTIRLSVELHKNRSNVSCEKSAATTLVAPCAGRHESAR